MTKPTEMDLRLMKQAWHGACACNASGVARTLVSTIDEIRSGHSSFDASSHPAVVLWVDVLRNLTGHDSVVEKAYSMCHEAATGKDGAK